MIRLFSISGAFLSVLTFLIGPAQAMDSTLKECLRCHEEMYLEVTSYPNMHTVVRDGCTKCHFLGSGADSSRKISCDTFLEKIIFNLGDISGDKKNHLIQIEARDTHGNTAAPLMLNTADEETLELPADEYELKGISGIKVEKIERKIFAKAVISWITPVPSASRVEYGTSEKDRNVLTANNIYRKEHRMELTGLRHKSKYSFTITSTDMNGKTVTSDKLTFDTTKTFDLSGDMELPQTDPELKPAVSQTAFMRTGDSSETFISISSNEPVMFKLTMAETDGEETRPCESFVQTRHSTITVCGECHLNDDSHPVAIRPKDPKIKTPEDLPTIENGLITCVTCHFGHGSETAHFLRAEEEKDLCVKCHPVYNGG